MAENQDWRVKKSDWSLEELRKKLFKERKSK